jgi:hypothetical protein
MLINENPEPCSRAAHFDHTTVHTGDTPRRSAKAPDALSDDETLSVIPVNSLGSTATGSSTTLVPEALAATDEFVSLLLEDRRLYFLLWEAYGLIEPDRLERNIKRLLRAYASDLRQEASGGVEKEAVQLVWSRVGCIAYIVCQHYENSPIVRMSRFEQLST